jgi:hypothetical protein
MVGSAGHVVHSGVFDAQNVDILFFILGWDRYRFHKKRIGTHYAELVFLHQMGFVGHVVHSGSSGAQNIDVLFFVLELDWYRLHKKCVKTRYSELVFLCIRWDLCVT